MEIRVLRYFLEIVRKGNFSAAAESLHITQPTLSRQIKDLEEHLGKELFIRGSRNVTLTEDGMLFKHSVEEIIGLIEKTESQMLSKDNSLSGDIYIGCGESESVRIIAKVISKIQKEYPNIKFHIFSGNTQDVTDKLDKGLLDFGLLIEPSDILKYDYIKLPTQDTWGVLMRKDSELSNLDFISPEDLRDKPIIISSQGMVKNAISGWIGGNRRKLNIVATYNLIFNASILVQENVGYALGLDNLMNFNDKSNLCFKPLYPSLKANLNIVWKKYKFFSKASEYFLSLLKEEIKNYTDK